MRVRELIAQLSELDPESDIYIANWDRVPEPARVLTKHVVRVETQNGRYLPAPVWVLVP